MTHESTNLGNFQDWELDAYADGETMPHVAAFFEQNPASQAAWLRQRKIEAPLSNALHRFDCPSPDTLRAYYWQELSKAESHRLENHLQTCPLCTAELAELQTFMQEDVPSPQNSWSQNLRERVQAVADQMRLVIATLVTPNAPQLATAALRSEPIPTQQGDAQTVLLFEADDTDISLLVQKEHNGLLRLAGQLFTTELTPGSSCKLIPATGEGVAVQAQIDDTGNFIVNQLPPGAYQLVVLLHDKSIVVPNLTLQ